MSLGHLGALALAGLVAPLCLGCGEALPGTLLGTYQVTATAATNTCGSGLGAPGKYQFDVELSQNDGKLYWSWLDNQPIASGALAAVSSSDASLQATITSTQSSNVDATATAAGPCTMGRTDTMIVVLGSGTPPGSFAGTLGYEFVAESGSDCADQLSSTGGMYDALPCTVTYTLGAARQ